MQVVDRPSESSPTAPPSGAITTRALKLLRDHAAAASNNESARKRWRVTPQAVDDICTELLMLRDERMAAEALLVACQTVLLNDDVRASLYKDLRNAVKTAESGVLAYPKYSISSALEASACQP